jgi:hypothetical protein
MGLEFGNRKEEILGFSFGFAYESCARIGMKE